MIWDFTCSDTLAPSLLRTMFTAGAAASSAENRKITKYADLEHSHIFIPVGIETTGVWGLGATQLVLALGRRLAIDSGDPRRSTFFLRQRIDITIQRGNVHRNILAALSGDTLPSRP